MGPYVRLGAGADNQPVPGVLPALESAVHHHAADKAARAQRSRHHEERQPDDVAGNVLGAHQVKGTGQQEARRKADFNCEPLFVQEVTDAGRAMEIQGPAASYKRCGEPAEGA